MSRATLDAENFLNFKSILGNNPHTWIDVHKLGDEGIKLLALADLGTTKDRTLPKPVKKSYESAYAYGKKIKIWKETKKLVGMT